MIGVKCSTEFDDSQNHSHKNHENKSKLHKGASGLSVQPSQACCRTSFGFETTWHSLVSFPQSCATRIVDVLDMVIEFEIPG